MGWVDAAGSTLVEIYGLSAVKRRADLESNLVSNQMVSGETRWFAASDIVGFAQASVGAVGGNSSTSPRPLPLLVSPMILPKPDAQVNG